MNISNIQGGTLNFWQRTLQMRIYIKCLKIQCANKLKLKVFQKLVDLLVDSQIRYQRKLFFWLIPQQQGDWKKSPSDLQCRALAFWPIRRYGELSWSSAQLSRSIRKLWVAPNLTHDYLLYKKASSTWHCRSEGVSFLQSPCCWAKTEYKIFLCLAVSESEYMEDYNTR